MNEQLFGYESDPIHPNFIVKQIDDYGITDRTVRVIDLLSPDVKTYLCWENPLSYADTAAAGMAAKRWFERHPEVKN